MNAARRGISCAFVVAVSCLPAGAADPPAANPAVASPQPPAAPATPPMMVAPPRPQLRTVHRQVSRLPLTRGYRSIPVGDAATVAAHEKIEAALGRVVDRETNFTETPLRDVVVRFGKILEVPVVLDMRALEVGGGNGSIRPLGDGAAPVLVVSQTADVHDEIEGLLQSLHERDLAEFGGPHNLPAAKTPVVRVHHVADEAVRRDLATKLVDLCNSSLPYGADFQAKVTVVGECLAVQSLTPEFHALAGQLIRAVAGEQVHDLQRSVYPGGEAGADGGVF